MRAFNGGGHSTTVRAMPTVSISWDSADLFDEMLSVLCRDTLAVCLTFTIRSSR